MSRLDEKDLDAPLSASGRGRRTLGSLRAGSGRLETVEGNAELPLRIVRVSMGRHASWAHVSGKGPTALYEFEREW